MHTATPHPLSAACVAERVAPADRIAHHAHRAATVTNLAGLLDLDDAQTVAALLVAAESVDNLAHHVYDLADNATIADLLYRTVTRLAGTLEDIAADLERLADNEDTQS